MPCHPSMALRLAHRLGMAVICLVTIVILIFGGGLSFPIAASQLAPDAGGSPFLVPNRSPSASASHAAASVADYATRTTSAVILQENLVSNISAITAGGSHTCALTTLGGVKCWGNNGLGQLGDGTTTDRLTPVDVSGLSSGVQAITAGSSHTCALTTVGGVKCWGHNGQGQLGDGTTTDHWTPVDVSGLSSGVQAITADYEHTCALTTGGGVKCWGYNVWGQLGDGTTTDRWTPVDVSGLSGGVQAITVGSSHTCALTTAGGVKCWGSNVHGELGDGTRTPRLAPVDVSGLSSGVQAITAGWFYTCALTTAGGVKCWGYNEYGQLGDGTTTNRWTPVDVNGLSSGVQAVTADFEHTCALTTAGGVKCWGYNVHGQLGDDTTTDRRTPVGVNGLSSGVHSIAAGFSHTCALTTAGGVKCWGNNGHGELGDGTTTDRWTPVDVNGLTSGVQAITAGGSHTCALTTLGGVKCWGYNGEGTLGDGTVTARWTPVDVTGLTSGVQAITAGGSYACALATAGGVKCWGQNVWGQLGDGTTFDRWTPVDVSGLSSGVQAITAGGSHTCALTTLGGVKCWGNNGLGQLGDGTTTDRLTPVDVSGLSSGVQAITAGFEHTCALTTVGGVKCWGRNEEGELGDGTVTDRLTPVDVNDLSSGVQSIAAGYEHTCALTTAGGVKCWGYNGHGELGDGTTTLSLTPVDVNGLTTGVQAITAGYEHTCTLTTASGVKCWGYNVHGQLGDGTTTDRWTPVDVNGLTSGVQSIAAGYEHTCALTTAGGVKCLGNNVHGELGVNPGWIPVDVLFPDTPAVDSAELADQLPYPTVAPGSAVHLWINVRNSGTTTWRASDGYGWTGTGLLGGESGSIWQEVVPGGILQYAQTITAPNGPGTYYYGFQLLHNGQSFGPHFFIQVTVSAEQGSLIGFKVSEDGYSFRNRDAGDGYLSGESLYYLFGEKACWSGSGPFCETRIDLSIWAKYVTQTYLPIGQCVGMSVTSLLYNRDPDRLMSIQPTASFAYQLLVKNPTVRGLINGYHIAQHLPLVAKLIHERDKDSLEQTVAAIEQGFANGNPVFLIMSESNRGHAVAPYKVVRLGEDTSIYVYDSETPNDSSRHIVVNLKGNTWAYAGIAGHIWDEVLFSVPISAFQVPLPLPLDYLSPSQAALPLSTGIPESETVHSIASQDNDLDTIIVSPGIVLRDASDQPLQHVVLAGGITGPSPTAYLVPSTQKYDVFVDRTGVINDQGFITYLGKGGLTTVDGLSAQAVSDSLSLLSDTGDLVYSPGSASTLTLTLSATDPAKDVLIRVQGITLGADATLTATLDTSQIAVALSGNSVSHYGLDISLNSTSALHQRFASTNVSVGPNRTQLIDIPAEIGASLPITTVIAETGQLIPGTLENELLGVDKLFLPLVGH